LGKIERPPFYAVAIQPADVGTAGGLLTDEHARVLRGDGSIIRGLYAAGNCTASVMGRVYPGAGASIANAFVFGYVAARHACAATGSVTPS
jgi:3-oxosteroid 1-dehydrogenase